MMDMRAGFAKAVEFLESRTERAELAKRRQAAVFKGELPDKWPAVASSGLTPEQEAWLPNPNLEEAFHDSDMMLAQQLRGALAAANANSDAVPSLRANVGVGNLLSLFGLDQDVFPDKMPWPRQHLTKARISKLTPDDMLARGDFALGLQHMARFKEVCGASVPVYCLDTQGPFDLAHLMLGDELFLEVYDDPPFVHHLLELCMAMCQRATDLCKELAGEPRTQSYHSCALYAENIGIRICEDTTAIVGPDVMEQFAMPYTARLAKLHGNAWVHYCGRNDALTSRLCAIPEVRAVNFGHVPGHEHDHIFEADMELIRGSGKVYFGNWPRRKDESDQAYLRRLHLWAVRGCLIPWIDGDIETLDFWYGL